METLFKFGNKGGGKCFDVEAYPCSEPSTLTEAERCENSTSALGNEVIASQCSIQVPQKSWSRDEKATSFDSSSSQGSQAEWWRNESDDSFELPTQKRNIVYRWLRWDFFSTYRRLFGVVFTANLILLVVLGARTALQKPGLNQSSTVTTAAVNLAISVLMRNEHVVNVLFLLSSSMQPSTPLFLRCWFAKIYGYGGIHSGCATAAVAWYLGFAGLVAHESFKTPPVDTAIASITCATVIALLIITTFAHPFLRARLHEWFECSHRFAGWVATILFWTQTFLIARRDSNRSSTTISKAVIQLPAFWCLVVITLCIAYPWTRLRRYSCEAEVLSPHAIRLHFSHRAISHCSAVRLATSPLKETHAFAAIPNASNAARGFSTVISNAGDWTKQIIDKPPQKLWIKSGPFYGVLRVAVMFKPVLIVATGSGIGPCLSLFRGVPGLDCRVLWSTPSPLETYGEEIMDDVLKADPGAIIIDTRKVGRPDLVRLTYEICKSKGCEAVVIISNPGATKKVVYGMETRGVPAYGPIFDS